RLEIDGRGKPHRSGRRNLRSILSDRVTARDAELVDAAIGLALDADDLVKLGGVEIDGRWSRGWRRGCQRGLAFCQRGADRGRELDRIAVSAHVHVERRRTSTQHVIMNRGNLQAVLDE